MAAYSPIQKNFTIDPFSVKKDFIPQIPIYKIFLYENINKGTFPSYQILGADKQSVISVAENLLDKFKLHKYYRIQVEKYINGWEPNPYVIPIITDLNTGEII